MEKERTELSSQDILPEDIKQITDVLNYEKWRDDGKYDHEKRDIEKKLKKANAIIKAKKGLNAKGKPSFGE